MRDRDDFFESFGKTGRKLLVVGVLANIAWLAAIFCGIYWLLNATGFVK